MLHQPTTKSNGRMHKFSVANSHNVCQIQYKKGANSYRLNTSLSAREVWVRFLGRYRPFAQLLSAQAIRAEGLGFDSRAGQIDTVSPTTCHRCDDSVFPRLYVVEMAWALVAYARKRVGIQHPSPLDDCRKNESFLF